MQRLIFLQGDSSCPAYFMIAVTFTSHPPTRSSQADKTALSLPVSPALYSDTSSSFVVCLSFPQLPLFLDTHRAVIYMQILICDWGKKKKERKKNQFFFLSQNKHCPQSCRLPPSISDLAPLIGRGLQRERRLLSPITG